MYLSNKYTRWYNAIINQAKARTLASDLYSEKHHIIPKSCGGNNDKENLVKLTAREHYIAHLLLTRMLTGTHKIKMLEALQLMSGIARYRVTSKMYEHAKLRLAAAYAEEVNVFIASNNEPTINKPEIKDKTSERPVCPVCDLRFTQINYIKDGIVHYRSKCKPCQSGKRKRIPQWARKGYKKKTTCDYCGYRCKYPEQIDVYHLDGNLNHNSATNLKSLCKNCQIIVRKKEFSWKIGDLTPDYV